MPTRDSNKDFPRETLEKVPAQNSIKHFPTYILAIVSTRASNKDFPNETLLQVLDLALICYFPCQVLTTVPTRDSGKNVPSETLLKVHLGAWPILGLNQKLPKLSLVATPTRGPTMNFQVKLQWNFQVGVWSKHFPSYVLVTVVTCDLIIEF